MTAPQGSTVGTIQRVNESVRAATNLHSRGLIGSISFVRQIAGDLRLLEAELLAAEEAKEMTPKTLRKHLEAWAREVGL